MAAMAALQVSSLCVCGAMPPLVAVLSTFPVLHEYALQPRNWLFSQTIRRSAIAFLLRALSLWAGHNQEIFLFSTSVQQRN